jgi:excisionase family DNA binding protein
MMNRLTYSVQEITALTGLSRSTLYREMSAGRLPYLKVGARRLITRGAIVGYISERSAV